MSASSARTALPGPQGPAGAAGQAPLLAYDWANGLAPPDPDDWFDLVTKNGYQALASMGLTHGGKILSGTRTINATVPQGMGTATIAGDFIYAIRLGYVGPIPIAQFFDILASYVDGSDVKAAAYYGVGWNFNSTASARIVQQNGANPVSYLDSGTFPPALIYDGPIVQTEMDMLFTRVGTALNVKVAMSRGAPFMPVTNATVSTGAGMITAHVNTIALSSSVPLTLRVMAFGLLSGAPP